MRKEDKEYFDKVRQEVDSIEKELKIVDLNKRRRNHLENRLKKLKECYYWLNNS